MFSFCLLFLPWLFPAAARLASIPVSEDSRPREGGHFFGICSPTPAEGGSGPRAPVTIAEEVHGSTRPLSSVGSTTTPAQHLHARAEDHSTSITPEGRWSTAPPAWWGWSGPRHDGGPTRRSPSEYYKEGEFWVSTSSADAGDELRQAYQRYEARHDSVRRQLQMLYFNSPSSQVDQEAPSSQARLSDTLGVLDHEQALELTRRGDEAFAAFGSESGKFLLFQRPMRNMKWGAITRDEVAGASSASAPAGLLSTGAVRGQDQRGKVLADSGDPEPRDLDADWFTIVRALASGVFSIAAVRAKVSTAFAESQKGARGAAGGVICLYVAGDAESRRSVREQLGRLGWGPDVFVPFKRERQTFLDWQPGGRLLELALLVEREREDAFNVGGAIVIRGQ